MNICIPIDNDNGLDSPLCLHFANAPHFIIVNTETLSFGVYENRDDKEQTDAERCAVLSSKNGVEAVVVGGIGLDALVELQYADLEVYTSSKETVRGIVSEVQNKELNPVTLGNSCKSGGRGFGGRGFSGAGCGGPGGCCC
jgi:predicted Fe-Mo cluster-binding NifX family protein